MKAANKQCHKSRALIASNGTRGAREMLSRPLRFLRMSSSRPPPARRVSRSRPGTTGRVTTFDDLPTTPYGIALVASAASLDNSSKEGEQPSPGFFVTAEAAPLLPLAAEESHVQPKASLAPFSASAPPEPEHRPGSLLWSRKWLIAGAATLAFVLAAVAGRLSRSPEAESGAAVRVREPAIAPQAPRSSPTAALQPTSIVEQSEPATLETQAQSNTRPAGKTKGARAQPVRAPRATARPAAKRPYTPTAI